MHVRIDQPYEESRLARRLSYGGGLKETASASILSGAAQSATSIQHRLAAGIKQSTSYYVCPAKLKEPCYLTHCNLSPSQSISEIKTRQPRRKQASILVWADLSISSIDRLNESTSSDHVKQVLADIFVLDDHRTDCRSAIVMDLFFHTLQFAKKEKFSKDKTSAFFSMIKQIFEMCIESPFDNKDLTYEHLKALLVCHSVHHPPYSIALFSANDVMRISQHALNTFFRHFDMYKYAFTPQVSLDLTLKYSEMPPSPPLPAAVNEDNINDEVASVGSKSNITSEYLENLQNEFTAQDVSEFLQNETKAIQEKISDRMNRAAMAMYTHINEIMKAKALNDTEQNNV